MFLYIRCTCRRPLADGLHGSSPPLLIRRAPSIQGHNPSPARRLFTSKPTAQPPATKTSLQPTTNVTGPPQPKAFARTDSKISSSAPPRTFTGTKGNTPPTPEAGKGYPARLLIYHAGTGRTVFIASVKLTAIFLFIFSAVLVAPAYYYSAYEPTWMAPAVVVAGAVPLLFMVFTSAPFVTYIHLALPLWARPSYPRLIRYAQNLPSTASVDITTLRWIWPRVTRLNVSELHIHKSQIGAMTIRRNIPPIVLEERKWWQWRPLRSFYVGGNGGKTAEPNVWENVVGCIGRGWSKRDVASKQNSAALRDR